MQSQTEPAITETEIANYLIHTPEFFERHAEVLASVQLTSPHSHRAISLQERQAEIMRARIRDLELKAAGMIRYGQTNVEITEKLHEWTCQLLTLQAPDTLPDAITQGLMETFSIPQVAMRLWGIDSQWNAPGRWPQASDAEREVAQGMVAPACGVPLDHVFKQWLTDPESVKSMAILPIGQDTGVFGALVLASDDERRFGPDMGTLFLQRVSGLTTAALQRLLP
ncbi:MAG: hypothetical protein RLZZ397_882 [Pseudomonadota bacterium]|jgi:uncharacterized protein YigA (DUF484 family)